MMGKEPDILALDFDGVVCDGLIEYFQTAWRAYCQLWSPSDRIAPLGLAEQFYRLRPVVESGWEMPVLIRSLLEGIPESEILQHWTTIAPQQAEALGLSPIEIAAQVDHIRDEWIASDLENWLAQHRFYPGVIDRLQRTLDSSVYPVIITTKEGRFVRQLLQQQQVELSESQIFGKEVGQPKYQTLRDLTHQFSENPTQPISIWFIEDRLKTLQGINTRQDLSHVTLYLASWGYNTATDRKTASQDPKIQLLPLEKFTQEFSQW